MKRGTHITLWSGLRFAVGLTAALAVGLWLTGPFAHAQQATGDGRALDANPQVGAGGVNQPSGRIDFRVRNDLITGNVGDGRAFRDSVGYTAPGEFRDRLGSDDLFRFRADSLSSSLDRLDAVQAARDYAAGAGTSVYRLHSQPHVSRELVPDDVSIGGYWEPARITDIDRPDRLTDRVTGRLDPDGRALEQRYAVSPLLGIRAEDADMFWPMPERPETPGVDEDDPELTDPLGEAEARLDTRVPGMVLGEYLRSPVARDADDPTERARLDQLERWGERWLEDRWTARVGDEGQEQAPRPAGDPYTDLLAAVREGDRLTDPMRERTLPADRLTELEDLEEPTPRDIERAEQRRRMAVERFDPRRTEDEARRATSEHLEALLERLDYALPRLASLAGERDDRVSETMREAEQRLTEGEYLDAERLYRRALAQRRHEPLARVGLVHAQLGAGMYRSAGMHLRHLFEQHPELIAARYAEELLPTGERLQMARDQLERMIEREDRTAGTSALLLAYIGHQAASERLVQLGLAHAEALHPRDPLLPMLRRIWLGDAADAGENPSAEPTQ